MTPLTLYYDKRHKDIQFGIDTLKKVLPSVALPVFEKNILDYAPGGTGRRLVVSTQEKDTLTHALLPGLSAAALEEGGFLLQRRGETLFLLGGDSAGAMYGLFELKERLETTPWDDVPEMTRNPHLSLRGIKFNLPFEPYDNGDPFLLNQETCLKREFWEAFLDFLALHRYNFLSLWSEHPFHLLFRLEKYPGTCPFSDTELQRRKDLFRFILKRAKERGIKTALITWNIRINSHVARGLGLPEELGDMEDQYTFLFDKFNYLPNTIRETYGVRQAQEVIKDYFSECIKTLLMTYRDLYAIGTNCAEEMKGDAAARQDWVREVYRSAIAASGRDIPFIMRTNMGNGKIAREGFLDDYPGAERFLSWKYSNAHMYSHPEPQFEKLWSAWEGMSFEDVKVLYTVRNDDFHTLRGCARVSYIREYFTRMKKDFVAGYYWGADGYLWGEDFQHIPHHHKSWQYDFDRQWYQFALIGRMSYDPALDESYWEERYARLYGDRGRAYFSAFQAAGDLIPGVNRLCWMNYDYEWHPESLLSVYGFKSVLDLLRCDAMPGVETLNLRESARLIHQKGTPSGETAGDILSVLDRSLKAQDKAIGRIEQDLPEEWRDSEAECVLRDLKCWRELTAYYLCKLRAALQLAFYELTSDPADRSKAVALLEEAVPCWERLAALWASHYLPYKMVRSKYYFGYSYYLEDVKRDISLAAGYDRADWGDEPMMIG